MACTSITYHGVTPAVWGCLKANLKAGGITVPPTNSGTISGHDITAAYNWDGAGNLSITVTALPFLITCGEVTGKIHSAIQACGGK